VADVLPCPIYFSADCGIAELSESGAAKHNPRHLIRLVDFAFVGDSFLVHANSFARYGQYVVNIS